MEIPRGGPWLYVSVFFFIGVAGSAFEAYKYVSHSSDFRPGDLAIHAAIAVVFGACMLALWLVDRRGAKKVNK